MNYKDYLITFAFLNKTRSRYFEIIPYRNYWGDQCLEIRLWFFAFVYVEQKETPNILHGTDITADPKNKNLTGR